MDGAAQSGVELAWKGLASVVLIAALPSGVAETGSASGERLMEFADEVQAGKLTTTAAIAKARAVIVEVTG